MYFSTTLTVPQSRGREDREAQESGKQEHPQAVPGTASNFRRGY